LSGGLLDAIDMLVRSAGDSAPDATRVVLLFTDGRATSGISDTAELVAAAQGALAGSSICVFTFGFGSDHDEHALQALASSTSSLYYYTKDAEAIPMAFADCLGGLMSVVMQNATLTLTAGDGATIVKVLGDAYTSTLSDDGTTVTVRLGDLYAEDKKDVLYEVGLSAGEGSAAHGIKVDASLRYFCVEEKCIKEASSVLEIARTADAATDSAINVEVDAQLNRLLVAEAIKAASGHADLGQLKDGAALLDDALAKLAASPSATSEMSRTLIEDVRSLRVGYEDSVSYSEWGSKRSRMSSSSHSYQRSTHDDLARPSRQPSTAAGLRPRAS